MTLYTVGHGSLPREQFVSVLRSSRIVRVVDIRARPGSQYSPHFNSVELMRWLPKNGIAYEWAPELGGFRTPNPSSKNGALDAKFRGFADFMETAPFRAAMKCLLDSLTERTAVMCSEADWRNCHRRLLADAAQLLFKTEVEHVSHSFRTEPHKAIDSPRIDSQTLRYDGGMLSLF